MATAAHGVKGIRQATIPSRDDVPSMRNVNEESFFHRNLWIPKDIQAGQYDLDISSTSKSIKLEGEVPVTFYDYLLDSGMFKYAVVPLQYLYENYGQVMAREMFPSIRSSSFSHQSEVGRLVGQPLSIIEFPTCHYAKDFLKAFSSEHIWNPRDRGDSLRPGVSFQLPLGSQHFTVAISIPYLGVEKNIGPPTRSAPDPGEAGGQRGLGPEILKRLEGLTDFREGPSLSWPRESLTLNQSRYPNADYENPQGNNVGERSILVHRAGIILLNTSGGGYGNDDDERLAIFRSCDDKNSGRVPLLPHQKSTNALDAFLNVLSNTLKSSEQNVLKNLRCKVSNYSLDFQKFARESSAPESFEALISNSATLSDELSAVIGVAKSQKRYIRDLQEFLTSLNARSHHPNGSLQLSGGWNEGRGMIFEKIRFLLEERQTFLDEVNEVFSEVKAIEKSFYQLSTLKTSQDMARHLGEAVATSNGIRSAIRCLRKEMVSEMQRQGKRFRKVWWKRIIRLRETPPPPPANDDGHVAPPAPPVYRLRGIPPSGEN